MAGEAFATSMLDTVLYQVCGLEFCVTMHGIDKPFGALDDTKGCFICFFPPMVSKPGSFFVPFGVITEYR